MLISLIMPEAVLAELACLDGLRDGANLIHLTGLSLHSHTIELFVPLLVIGRGTGGDVG